MKWFVVSFIFIGLSGVLAENCDSEHGVCFNQDTGEGVPWYEFDWKTYVKKDIQDGDKKDPLNRFGIHLLNSVDLGVNRTIRRTRPDACGLKDWKKLGTLPRATVIITYRDEPRSTLLRTVVSVIEQSPSDLLEEIILIDDNNEDATIGSELSSIAKVRVLRNEKREGLIRSRIIGTKAAKGEVLVFLDSHCECEPGWLEPLLFRVKANPKRLASPVINNINLYSYEIEPVSTYLRGGFNWNLDFFWEWIPARDRARRIRDPTYSFKTPAIAGGLFAIDRQWFMDLGLYDDGMEIWGAENIELSLRIWTCGGEMEIVPCSKVGHIYKQKNVYSYPDGPAKTKTCNNRRIAQVWMDSFKAIYDLTLSRSELETDCKDAPERVKLRSELKCEPFDWYLDTVYPELQIPLETDLAFGQIHFNQPSFLTCIDNIAIGHESGIGANSCLQSYHLQEYRLTKDNLIFHDDFCFSLSALKSGSVIVSMLCDKNDVHQQWIRHRPTSKKALKSNLKGYQIKHLKSDLCLDTTHVKTKGVMAVKCNDKEVQQRFLFSYNIVKA